MDDETKREKSRKQYRKGKMKRVRIVVWGTRKEGRGEGGLSECSRSERNAFVWRFFRAALRGRSAALCRARRAAQPRVYYSAALPRLPREYRP